MILFYYKILYSLHYYSSFRLYFTVVLKGKGNFSLFFDGKLHIYSNLEGNCDYSQLPSFFIKLITLLKFFYTLFNVLT